MRRARPTPWQRIVRAAWRGTGVRLTAEEVMRLGADDAILRRAEKDDAEDNDDSTRKGRVPTDGE